jgi:hypothetical protein
VLLSSLLILLETSLQGVGNGELLVRADTGVPPDAQAVLVSTQPAAYIVRAADRASRRRAGTADAVRTGHEMR